MKYIIIGILITLSSACVTVGDSDCILVPDTLICVEK